MEKNSSGKIMLLGRHYISGDLIFKLFVGVFALSIIALVILLLKELIGNSWLSITRFGAGFLFGGVWDPVSEVFGALPFIFGTIASSLIALIIAVPLSIGIAIYLSEIAPRRLMIPLSFVIELLAAIPSVIIGLWGIFFLAPFIRDFVAPVLGNYLGFIPLFQGTSYGLSMLTGSIILAIMILPIISSVSKEVLLAVPDSQREAAIALGATRWERTRMVVLPYASSGIFGAIILGLGRAIGETMAITMVIGNRPEISWSILAPSYTMAAVIANEFTEATSNLHISALFEIGFLLFVISIIVNIMARLLVGKTIKMRITE